MGAYWGNIGPTRKSLMFDSISKGLNDFTNTYFANKELDRLEKDPTLKDAPLSEKFKQVQRSMGRFGEYGEKMVNSAVKDYELKEKEQVQERANKEQKAMSNVINKINAGKEYSDKDLEGVQPQNQLKIADYSRSNRVADGLYKTMVDAGVPEDIARNQSDIVRSSEKGTGQTYAIQGANDLINRFRNIPESEPFSQNIGSGKFSKINPEFEYPLPEKVEGLTLKERASLKHEYTQQNLKDYNENRSRKRNLEEDKYSFRKLQELNPYISTGVSKWNIDPRNGEIILPALASPEERQFAKLIVRQLRNAKDTYGARVTNFDAAKYLEGFPSLGDSPEAREAILKDLQLVNELNLLHSNAMEEVYRTYKPGEISPQQAEQIADDMARDQTKEMWDRFVKVPNPNQPKKQDVKIEDAKTLEDLGF